jgi:stearoyl-CoA desaturase (delta-9 desaturase)
MPSTADAPVHRPDDIAHPAAIPFLLVHLGCFGAIWSGVTWPALALGLALYWLRMFAVTAGYHRYFSHRAFATGRIFQFILAALAQSTGQKSVLWWAAKHRHHHLYSDTSEDIHSPRRMGFFYSHVGWLVSRRHATTDLTSVADFARYPELRWLHRYDAAPAVVLGVVSFLIAGWAGLVVGFLWSTVLVYHATFCINSLAHVSGARRYVTGDDSRNNPVLALLTMGEGWHNNHHAFQSSARQGFFWWEVDVTFYALKALSWLGLVRDLKTPPASVVRNEHRLGARVIHRTAAQLAARFSPEKIAKAVHGGPPSTELASLEEALAHDRGRVADILAGLRLPSIPSRADLVAEARRLFARTKSFDDIVDKAREMLLAAIGDRLCGLTARVAVAAA